MNNDKVKKVVLFSTRKIHERFDDTLIPQFSNIILSYFTQSIDSKDVFPDLKKGLVELSTQESVLLDDVSSGFDARKQEFVQALSPIIQSIKSLLNQIQENTEDNIPDSLEVESANDDAAIACIIKDFLDRVSYSGLEESPDFAPKVRPVLSEYLSIFSKHLPKKIDSPQVSFNEEYYERIKDMTLGASNNELSRRIFHCDIDDKPSFSVKDRLCVFSNEEEDCAVCAIYAWYGDFEENHYAKWISCLIQAIKELYPKVVSVSLVLHDRDLYQDNRDEIVYSEKENENVNVSLAVFMHNNDTIMQMMDKNKSPKEIVEGIDLYFAGPPKLREVDHRRFNKLAHFLGIPKTK